MTEPRRPDAARRLERPAAVAAAATAGAGIACALGAWVAAGSAGMLSAVLATVVVVAFFSSGIVPLLLADQARLNVRPGLGLLLLTYVLRLALVLVVLAVLASAPGLHQPSLGVTLIVCALVWSLARLVAVVASSRP